MKAQDKAKAALWRAFTGTTDEQGYVNQPSQNLIEGVNMGLFEDDLRKGDGNELRMKFCAVHSSAALAVNCFAPFKDRRDDLVLLGHEGALEIKFERKLDIIDGRRPANLDVWVNQGDRIIAVESKFLEYLSPKKRDEGKKPPFAPDYDKVALDAEEDWRKLFEKTKGGYFLHLDAAQLIKHYFGLRRYQREKAEGRQIILLYLYWEPKNADEIAECVKHREEVAYFKNAVGDSSITFVSMTYPDLWREWLDKPNLAAHAMNLMQRYKVAL